MITEERAMKMFEEANPVPSVETLDLVLRQSGVAYRATLLEGAGREPEVRLTGRKSRGTRSVRPRLIAALVGSLVIAFLLLVASPNLTVPIDDVPVAESVSRAVQAHVEELEGGSWQLYCVSAPPPTHIQNAWNTNRVTLDGAPSDEREWSEATGVFLPLDVVPGPSNDRCEASMTAWFMNDDTWLYGLLYVPWNSQVDPDDHGGIQLFRGQSCCGVDSDFGTVPLSTEGDDTEPWDAHGWNGVQWFSDLDATPPGTIDIEGTGSFDGTGYWFEWRKALDSGDANDWVLKPGQTVGDVSTLNWFLVNLWDDSDSLSYEHVLTMTLASEGNE